MVSVRLKRRGLIEVILYHEAFGLPFLWRRCFNRRERVAM